MATLVRNNTGSNLPLPAAYGGGYVRNTSAVIVNDTLSDVVAALGSIPGDGVHFLVVADGQPGSITPIGVPGIPTDPPVTNSQLLARTPNAKILGGIAEGPAASAT